jgi:hypothetical protein
VVTFLPKGVLSLPHLQSFVDLSYLELDISKYCSEKMFEMNYYAISDKI